MPRAASLPSLALLLPLLLLALHPARTAAQQINWSAASGGSWHDAANWDLARVPATDDVVGLPVFGAPSTLNITVTSAVTVRALVVGGATRLLVTGTSLNVTGAELLLDGELALSDASLAAPVGVLGNQNGLLALAGTSSVAGAHVNVTVLRVAGGVSRVTAPVLAAEVVHLTSADSTCSGVAGLLDVQGGLEVSGDVAYLVNSAGAGLVRVSGLFNCSSCAFALDLTQSNLPIAATTLLNFTASATSGVPTTYGSFPVALAGQHNDSAFCVNFTSPFTVAAGCPAAVCNSGWSGMGCATAVCPSDCSGRGACVAAPVPYCSCSAPYTGADCSASSAAKKGGWNTRAKIAVGLGVGIFALSICIAVAFLAVWIIQMGPRRA